MAREIEILGRRYWILSEPEGGGWKAHVVAISADGTGDEVGIEAIGDTRVEADAAAERKLRRLTQA